MKKPTMLTRIVSVTALMMLSGCGDSYHARSVDTESAILVNPRILQKGSGDEALYRYKSPKVNFSQYTKVIIDPILISKASELDSDEYANYEKLANNAYVYLARELEKQFKLVNSPEPGTIRVQMAIVDADTSKPVRNVLSFTPIGLVLNLVKYTATGKQTSVGEVTGEVKLTDAMTGGLIGAALDRRVGGKSAEGIYDTWSNADAGLQYWAKKIGFVLCEGKGGRHCANPD